MIKRKLTKRESVILGLTIGVIAASLFYSFLAAPLLKANASLNSSVLAAQLKLNKYLLLESRKPDLQQAYSALTSQADAGQGTKDTLVSFLAELENLAQSSSIRIKDIRPQQINEKKTLHREIVIEVRTEGNLEDYVRFIYNLENSLSLFSVKRFQLNALPNQSLLEGYFTISRLSL